MSVNIITEVESISNWKRAIEVTRISEPKIGVINQLVKGIGIATN